MSGVRIVPMSTCSCASAYLWVMVLIFREEDLHDGDARAAHDLRDVAIGLSAGRKHPGIGGTKADVSESVSPEEVNSEQTSPWSNEQGTRRSFEQPSETYSEDVAFDPVLDTALNSNGRDPTDANSTEPQAVARVQRRPSSGAGPADGFMSAQSRVLFAKPKAQDVYSEVQAGVTLRVLDAGNRHPQRMVVPSDTEGMLHAPSALPKTLLRGKGGSQDNAHRMSAGER